MEEGCRRRCNDWGGGAGRVEAISGGRRGGGILAGGIVTHKQVILGKVVFSRGKSSNPLQEKSTCPEVHNVVVPQVQFLLKTELLGTPHSSTCPAHLETHSRRTPSRRTPSLHAPMMRCLFMYLLQGNRTRC